MFRRVCQRFAVVAVLLVPPLTGERGLAQLPTNAGEPSLMATPNLIREIQFMLLSLGIDPGPLDGNSRQLTNRAVHAFQEASGLPVTDLNNNEPVSAAFVDRLRKAAAQVLLRGSGPAPTSEPVGAPP